MKIRVRVKGATKSRLPQVLYEFAPIRQTPCTGGSISGASFIWRMYAVKLLIS
jgi:hypothetical protein